MDKFMAHNQKLIGTKKDQIRNIERSIQSDEQDKEQAQHKLSTLESKLQEI